MKPIALLIAASACAFVFIGIETTMNFGFRGLAHGAGLAACLLCTVALVSVYLKGK